ncbi:tRNA-splicing endonuclease subunit tsp-1 like protein [Verticillium longisporum]|nr:tRNA-splicing endonuclease subunit tsp-1 like protein [Verticillium longisporum]
MHKHHKLEQRVVRRPKLSIFHTGVIMRDTPVDDMTGDEVALGSELGCHPIRLNLREVLQQTAVIVVVTNETTIPCHPECPIMRRCAVPCAMNHTHFQSPANNVDGHLPRPVLSGLPPRRIYVHPDEQIEALQSGQPVDTQAAQRPEREWVVPVHITEKLSLRKFSAIFDNLDVLPPGTVVQPAERDMLSSGRDWRGAARHKRILVAVIHADSTISYYLVHDGIVKPRQN